MQKSESIAKLAEALSKTQGQIKGALKDTDNPFFKRKYADLTSVWDACREQLSSNGLSVVQTTDDSESGVIVETFLIHSSGEWIGGRLRMKPVKDDPQGVGSAITYARRYALAAIVGVAPEDDDGNEASGLDVEKKQEASKAAPAKSEEKKSGQAKTDTAFQKFINEMGDMRKKIGDKTYYAVLGSSGFKHSNEIKTRDQQIKVFRELAEKAKEKPDAVA